MSEPTCFMRHLACKLIVMPRELAETARLRRAAGDESAACAFEAAAMRYDELVMEAREECGRNSEATLPRIEERAPDGSLAALFTPQGATEFLQLELIMGRFAMADRAVSAHVADDVYHAGTALTVLHQVADALSGGDATLLERLSPNLTEAAARLKAPQPDSTPWP